MSDLEARITEVLARHQWYDTTTDNEDPSTGCTGCDDWFSDENAIENGAFATHQTAMLAPVIAEQVKAERAEQAANMRRMMNNRYSSFDETYSIPGRDLQNHVLVLEGREPFTDEDDDE